MMKKRFWILMFCIALAPGFAGAHEGEAHEENTGAVQKVTGEVVDLACYLGSGGKEKGPGHRDCAQKCIVSGLPVGIKTANGLYLVVSSEHQPVNKELAPLASKKVVAEGTVSESNGVHLLAMRKVTVVE